MNGSRSFFLCETPIQAKGIKALLYPATVLLLALLLLGCNDHKHILVGDRWAAGVKECVVRQETPEAYQIEHWDCLVWVKKNGEYNEWNLKFLREK